MTHSDKTPTTNVRLASSSNLLTVLLRRWTKNGAFLFIFTTDKELLDSAAVVEGGRCKSSLCFNTKPVCCIGIERGCTSACLRYLRVTR